MTKRPNATFRVDASTVIGTGHVMRCLTLARGLAEAGWQIRFVSAAHPGNLNSAIAAAGFALAELPSGQAGFEGVRQIRHSAWLGRVWHEDADLTAELLARDEPDLLIIDHYALDRRWEDRVGVAAERIVVIDDLADRPHRCAMLIDANLGCDPNDYVSLVQPETEVLTGPQYALLRPEFAAIRQQSLMRRRDEGHWNLLISMGGVDAPNATGAVLDTLAQAWIANLANIDIVLGVGAPWRDAISSTATALPCPVKIHVGAENMAALMAAADLSIGGAGVTAWERCCVGLPAVVVVIAENQRRGANALAESGAGLFLGGVEDVPSRLGDALRALSVPGRLARMRVAASHVSDGEGARRVIARLETLLH